MDSLNRFNHIFSLKRIDVSQGVSTKRITVNLKIILVPLWKITAHVLNICEEYFYIRFKVSKKIICTVSHF